MKVQPCFLAESSRSCFRAAVLKGTLNGKVVHSCLEHAFEVRVHRRSVTFIETLKNLTTSTGQQVYIAGKVVYGDRGSVKEEVQPVEKDLEGLVRSLLFM